MRITFWGTRGSIAKPGPATARYGGNTSCVEVRSDAGTLIVIDCGTGGHALGHQLVAQNKDGLDGHILISHTHWDHIQGIPFFAPLFIPEHRWDIYGPKGLSESLRAALAGQMQHTYFPITINEFAAAIRYHDLVEGTFTIGDIRVTTRYLNHPALTLGYRLEADGATLVYCCDHEPHSAELATGEHPITGVDRRHADFLAGADLVVHDAQYLASEYPEKIGWGHSPAEYVVRVARDAGIGRLVLTHHDPLRDDDAVDRLMEGVRENLRRAGADLDVQAAAEGMTLHVSPGDAAAGRAPAAPQFKATTPIDPSTLARPVLLHVVDSQLMAALSEAVSSEELPRRVAADTDELLQALREDRPSLVVIEHAPPQIDGEKAARAVRQSEPSGAIQVPIVLVTAGEHQKMREKGIATDWLVAPFSLSYARTKIRSWVLRTAVRWVRAQKPAGESRRLAVLHDLAILDTPHEERYDRVTRIAAASLGVPIALVSLVDRDRQWFKSCYGLGVDETSRDAAFCAHVVENSRELVVPDTLQDDRFADNPLVTGEPHIRFYAGAPLILEDGSCIGTLCLIDTRPRTLSSADLATLRDLRDLALEEIKRTEPAAAAPRSVG